MKEFIVQPNRITFPPDSLCVASPQIDQINAVFSRKAYHGSLIKLHDKSSYDSPKEDAATLLQLQDSRQLYGRMIHVTGRRHVGQKRFPDSWWPGLQHHSVCWCSVESASSGWTDVILLLVIHIHKLAEGPDMKIASLDRRTPPFPPLL